MQDIFTPELIELITTSVAGGFTAYHGIKIGLYVLGKFMERRKAKKEAEVEEQNTQERRRIGRLLEIVTGVVGAINQKPAEPEQPTAPPASDDRPSEAVDIEEIVRKVIDSLKKNK